MTGQVVAHLAEQGPMKTPIVRVRFAPPVGEMTLSIDNLRVQG